MFLGASLVTIDPHLRIATSGNESIGFFDGGPGGTENVRIAGNGDFELLTGDLLIRNGGNIKFGSRINITETSGTLQIGDVSGNDEITVVDIKAYGGNGRVYLTDSEIFFNGSSNSNAGFKMDSQHFHSNGDVIAYSSTLTASDRRLKENIQPIEDALSKVSQLNGVTFTYKADGKESAGLIAQDVEKVLPSAISEKELPLKVDDGNEYKVLQYDQTIGLLVEAIKELTAKVEELENK